MFTNTKTTSSSQLSKDFLVKKRVRIQSKYTERCTIAVANALLWVSFVKHEKVQPGMTCIITSAYFTKVTNWQELEAEAEEDDNRYANSCGFVIKNEMNEVLLTQNINTMNFLYEFKMVLVNGKTPTSVKMNEWSNEELVLVAKELYEKAFAVLPEKNKNFDFRTVKFSPDHIAKATTELNKRLLSQTEVKVPFEIPKGGVSIEDFISIHDVTLACALRELQEETGFIVPEALFDSLEKKETQEVFGVTILYWLNANHTALQKVTKKKSHEAHWVALDDINNTTLHHYDNIRKYFA